LSLSARMGLRGGAEPSEAVAKGLADVELATVVPAKAGTVFAAS